MADRRNFFRLRSLPAGRMLGVLAELEDCLADLRDAGACLTIEALGAARLYLPHPDHLGAARRPMITTALDRAADAMQRIGGVVFDRRASGSAPLPDESFVDLSLSAPVLLTVDSATTTYTRPAQPDPGQRLALYQGKAADLAAPLATLIRSARNVRIVGDDRDERAYYAVQFDADPDRGALFQAPERDGALVFDGYPTPAGTLYIDHALSPGHEQLAAAGRINRVFPHDLIAVSYRPQDDRLDIFRIDPPEEDALTALSPETPGGLSVNLVHVADHKTALTSLQQEITEHGFPVGYRVRLRQVAEVDLGAARAEDIEAQIDILQARLAMLDGLRAQHLSLLRFSPAQLGGMIDALRRVPRTKIANGGVRYAFGHHPDAAKSAHFLLCHPDVAGGLLRFSEPYWRATTDARPMVYWVDPIWARHQVHETETRALVFTPRFMTLEPSLATFGSDLEQTLQTVAGQLFLGEREPSDRPIYVFTPGDNAAEMAVEVLDQADFGPLEAHIKWLNDHLDLRPTARVDAALLEQVSGDLYEGWAADKIKALTGQSRQAMHDDFTAVKEELDAGLDDLAGSLADEIDAATEALRAGFEHLRTIEKRLLAVEQLCLQTTAILERREADVDALSDLPEDLAVLREHIRTGLLREFERTENMTIAAERWLDQNRSTLEKLGVGLHREARR